MSTNEIYVSVDVEAAGPVPGKYSLLSIGACAVYNPERVFSSLLKPLNQDADPEALKVSKFTLDQLERDGVQPEEAMLAFEAWLKELAPDENDMIVFVGLNAPFDWSFINYYFHVFLGRNPFGFTALDLKAYYMGVTGCAWTETGSSRISKWVKAKRKPDHDAVHDAQFQAELFTSVWAKAARSRRDLRRR